MNRVLKALGAFSLSLALILALGAQSLCMAAEDPQNSTPSAGYLLILDPQAQAAPFSLAQPGQATLSAAEAEQEELLPIAEEMNIYKTDDLTQIQNLVWSGQVVLAEPDYQAELLDLDLANLSSPNDDYFVSRYQYNLENSNIQAAWDAGLTGEGVSVAVIDSGLNATHLDAPVKVARGRYYYYREKEDGRWEFTVNGVTKRYGYYSSDYTMDNLGHGSMVSGIIAANTNNRSDGYTGGIAGAAPNATIIPIRCFTATQGHIGGYASNLISGVNYAVQNGADIINMSWGLREESISLKNALTTAANSGCILIAAAGNDGDSRIQYPAVYDNVISVGSVDRAGALSDFSQRSAKVNICAPGGSRSGAKQPIYSLGCETKDTPPNVDPNKVINYGVGTSFSAPLIAAAAALLKEHDPTMTQQDFLTLLRDHSDPVTTQTQADQAYVGYGTLNMGKLLDATGHTGSMLRYESDGSLTVRPAYYPQATGTAPTNSTVLVGVYNAAGHLLDSVATTVTKAGGHAAYSTCVTFPALEGAASVRTFFLDNQTLAPLTTPSEAAILR